MSIFDRIHHVAIICSDYKRSKKFYTDILGFEVIRENFREERNSFKLDLKVNDLVQLELFSFPNVPHRPSHPEAAGLRHLAFTVDDVGLTKQILEDKGIVVEHIRKDPYTGRKFTFFADPDGLPIELYEA